EILVRGKGLLHDRMPLPADVGEALASYLRRDRPHCRTRRVFVCTKAPRRGFAGPSTLTTIVRRALDRANLHPEFKGAHLLRHSLGFRLREPGGLLRNFVAFLQAEGASHITRELALRWATQPAKDQPATWAGRLGMVRRFAIWHSAIDPRTEIPPVGLLPHRYRRKPPH